MEASDAEVQQVDQEVQALKKLGVDRQAVMSSLRSDISSLQALLKDRESKESTIARALDRILPPHTHTPFFFACLFDFRCGL